MRRLLGVLWFATSLAVLAPMVSATHGDPQNEAPVLSIFAEPRTAVPGESIFFWSVVNDTDGAADVVFAEWQFGDGNRKTGQSLIRSYAAPGTYVVRFVVRDTESHEASQDMRIQIRNATATAAPTDSVPALEPAVLAVTVATGGLTAVALAVALQESARWKFLLLFSPLFTRLARSEIMDHDVRESIYAHVRDHPGAHLRGIKRDLALQHGTLLHHLQTLEREEYLRSVRDGMYRRYFVTGSTPAFPPGASLTERIARHIDENPGVRNVDLCGAFGKKPNHIHYHVRRLHSEGRIRLEKRGRDVFLFPAADAPADETAS